MNRRNFFKFTAALPFVGVPVALMRTQREAQVLAVAQALASTLASYSGGITWVDAEYDERVFDAVETEYQRALKGDA